VFLATLGPQAAHTGRATAAANLFASAGFEALQPGGLDAPEAAAEAFTSTGTPVACLCGSDADYAALAGEVVRALREAGATRILLMGGEPDGGHGADTVITDDIDAVALLRELCEELGVAP
jgi:methylmalonyl-CoA mutase